jgi:autotransporter translocation and assembly factor TamB
LTVGKRISDRIYLTYSRSLSSAARDQVILLEYDQSDRLSWVLTQNEDRTYALDVRVRHVFK